MNRELFYLDDFTDEVMPSQLEGSTLEAWAKWLSRGGERDDPYRDPDEDDCWCFDPPADGTEYAGSSLTFEDDVIATCSGDGEAIRFSRPVPPDADFMAIRFAPGLGWDAESILDPTCTFGRSIEQQLIEAIDLERGEECNLAIARTASVKLLYRADPPRLEIVAAEIEA